jgi:glucose-6-phosphate isomerase
MAFGVADNRIFQMRDWIGGRFSLWSAAGVSCALDLGVDVAAALRQGAYDMDQHFHTAPFAHNMPVMMAMIGLWNTTYLGYNTLAVLPYAQALHRLPAYLQQLEMESNGKSMSINAEPLQYPTCPVIFGEAGANGQHSFHQLLHQSNTIVPSDFIVPFAPTAGPAHHHIALMANAFAQSEALMAGRSLAQAQAMLREKGISEDEITHQAPHWVCPGNRPSTTITMPALTAEALGALIALYEHKVYVQGVMWGINSFDQFGVELGKTLAKPLENALCTGAPAEGFSPSTQNLLARAQQANQARSNEASSIASITHAIPAHA